MSWDFAAVAFWLIFTLLSQSPSSSFWRRKGWPAPSVSKSVANSACNWISLSPFLVTWNCRAKQRNQIISPYLHSPFHALQLCAKEWISSGLLVLQNLLVNALTCGHIYEAVLHQLHSSPTPGHPIFGEKKQMQQRKSQHSELRIVFSRMYLKPPQNPRIRLGQHLAPPTKHTAPLSTCKCRRCKALKAQKKQRKHSLPIHQHESKN